jgi:transcriptional regulator with XRE-family HTH domain
VIWPPVDLLRDKPDGLFCLFSESCQWYSYNFKLTIFVYVTQESFYFSNMAKKKKGPAPGTLYKNVRRTQMGMRLASLRRTRGLSQVELAALTGLTQRAVSYYERESETIPSHHLQKIAKALSVSTDEILSHKPDQKDIEANRAFLRRLEIAKTLPEPKQKILSDMIDEMTGKKG